jgi:hypothetical protein
MNRFLMRSTESRVKLILLLCLSLCLNNYIQQRRWWGYLSFSTIEHVEWKEPQKVTDSTCLFHKPIYVHNVVRNPRKQHLQIEANEVLQQPSPHQCGNLQRPFWRDGYTVQSMLAKQIERHQTNCSLPTLLYHLDNQNGIGAHLHLWSQAACNAHDMEFRIRTYNPSWIWLDQAYCQYATEQSPFFCYFSQVEDRCGTDAITNAMINQQRNVTSPLLNRERCARMQKQNFPDDQLREQFVSDYRAASTEYMFQRIAPIVIQEAERQVGLLFQNTTHPHDRVMAPSDLISVHLRWGDKFFEMELVSIEEYIRSISFMLTQVMGRPNDHKANIYLSTEDPSAVQEFMQKVPYKEWTVYVDRSVVELNPFRPQKGNRASWTTRNTNGRAGLVALGSLLVAMEASYYILTTGSNWSRLMNELRKNVIDPRCNNCTHMIDLRPGEW